MNNFGKIEVLNYKTDNVIGALCIMQSKGATLGNPFYRMKNRLSSIRKFRAYLWVHVKKRGAVHSELMRLTREYMSGKTVRIYCCCKPLPCHGDVIKSCIEWLARTISKNFKFSMSCKQCDWAGTPTLSESGKHIKASCASCGAYIKFTNADERSQINS